MRAAVSTGLTAYCAIGSDKLICVIIKKSEFSARRGNDGDRQKRRPKRHNLSSWNQPYGKEPGPLFSRSLFFVYRVITAVASDRMLTAWWALQYTAFFDCLPTASIQPVGVFVHSINIITKQNQKHTLQSRM